MRDRIRLVAGLVALSLIVPVAALAQEGGGLPTGGMALGFLILFAVVGAGVAILREVAPKTTNTIDDTALQALEWIGENREMIEEKVRTVAKWEDPEDPAVPPSPANPTGEAT